MSTTGKPILRGSCHCRALSYVSTSLPSNVQICHCTTCRALSGSASLTFADFPRSSLTFTSDATRPSSGILAPDDAYPMKILRTSDAAFRGFCLLCGTPLIMVYHCQPDCVSVPMGSIDEGSVVESGRAWGRPVAHIFMKEKAEWEVLGDDGIERLEEFSRDFAGCMRTWEEGRRSKVKPPTVH